MKNAKNPQVSTGRDTNNNNNSTSNDSNQVDASVSLSNRLLYLCRFAAFYVAKFWSGALLLLVVYAMVMLVYFAIKAPRTNASKSIHKHTPTSTQHMTAES